MTRKQQRHTYVCIILYKGNHHSICREIKINLNFFLSLTCVACLSHIYTITIFFSLTNNHLNICAHICCVISYLQSRDRERRRHWVNEMQRYEKNVCNKKRGFRLHFIMNSSCRRHSYIFIFINQ